MLDSREYDLLLCEWGSYGRAGVGLLGGRVI